MIDFPLYMPEKKEDNKMAFYRFARNQFNDKNYILCLTVTPSKETLDVLGFNSFKVLKSQEELKNFFEVVSRAESSIEGILLLNEDGQNFLSLK
ncbi:hypothetical protein [Clostridium sp.]|uniref:hypothetical protein n=1 Tax=Clostridium sp. TaxID=1506 RepID=UPI002FCB5682